MCSFYFFHAFFAIICACPFDKFMPKPFAALPRPKFCLLSSLFVFLTNPKLTLFFLPRSRVSKCCPTRAFVHILVLFRVPSFSQVPLHPSLSIITHEHSFLIIFGNSHKTSCPGKFPRPYGQKPCLVCQNMLVLTLFSCPPARTYPIAPIRTHLYTVALVHTLNYNVYMYYLC